MKDDYLWDMTGNDPKIARMESVLEVFRYQETKAPELPAAKPLRAIENANKRPFAFAFAFAAIAVVVTAAGVWFQSLSTTNVAEDLAVSAPLPTESGSPGEHVLSGDDGPNPIRLSVVEQPGRRRVVGHKAARTLSDQRAKLTVRRSGDRMTAGLTERERYAYEQLMLALSITSSKLQIVQDTIDGVDGSTSPSKVYEY
jgi:hypothetical protein